MADDRLERAIGLVQSGKMEEARELLEFILKEDRHHLPAWHWYAQTWPEAADKVRVWEVCLRHNPENPLAQEALKDLKFSQRSKMNADARNPIIKTTYLETNASSWLLWTMIGMFAIIA